MLPAANRIPKARGVMTTGTDETSELDRLRRRAERERLARLQAESVAEASTRQIYERQRQVQLLQAIADAANSTESPESCLSVTLREWCRFTSWPVGHAYQLDVATGRLVSSKFWNINQPQAFAFFREASENMTFAPGVGLPGRVLASGASAWIVDIMADTNFPRAQACPNLKLHGAFAFPALVGKEVVAVLEFFSTAVEAPNVEWLELATQVGTQIGRVFERQRARTALQREVEERQRAEMELKELQPQLIEASRDAGRAEVATGVLHNVGNVLNSVNISMTELREMLSNSSLPFLEKSVAMIGEHKDDLADFLAHDPKGKLLPGFLERLCATLLRERQAVAAEVAAMERHLDHVKNIVSMQQNYARPSGMLEALDPAALVEDALNLVAGALEKHQITVERKMESAQFVLADRNKTLQILVNLLVNSRQAIVEGRSDKRLIQIEVRPALENRVAIAITDSGVGIPFENLVKIFRHGFTTKHGGHGFGLHASVLAAREMNGDLQAQSPGPGLGASFTLELPQTQK